jgi:PII-like signaling protein
MTMTSARLSEAAQLLSIYINEGDKWRGQPLYTAIIETLKEEGIAGATVLRGLTGFGAHSKIHTESIWHLSGDLPLCIKVLDNPRKIAQALDLIAPMMTEGMLAVEDVHVVKYTG